MTTTRYKFNKEGALVPDLPAVKLGNERLDRSGVSRLSGNQVVCNQHGTKRACRVFCHGIIVLCCRNCIMENCQLTKARMRPNWDECRGALDNPVGHSY